MKEGASYAANQAAPYIKQANDAAQPYVKQVTDVTQPYVDRYGKPMVDAAAPYVSKGIEYTKQGAEQAGVHAKRISSWALQQAREPDAPGMGFGFLSLFLVAMFATFKCYAFCFRCCCVRGSVKYSKVKGDLPF
jgi:hypothetical protein